MLKVEHLAGGYRATRVLFDVSFEIAEGEVVTLLGRNGMGKTTTIMTLFGMLPASGGSIAFRGRSLTGRPSHEIARCGLGLVPEGRQVFPTLTVRENLIATASASMGRRQRWKVEDVLDLFPGLRPRLRSYGALLSGGEQQMLAIGRALMTNPDLLVLDEATEGLAPVVRSEIWRVLRLLKDRGQSILIIDKNLKDLIEIGTRHYVIEKGRVVWCGTSDALRANDDVKSRYLSV